MQTVTIDVSVRGKIKPIEGYQIFGRTIIVGGGWLKTAQIHDEEWQDSSTITDPSPFLTELRKCRRAPDLFAFASAEPEEQPRFSCDIEWDNVAVIRLSTYKNWWDRLPQESRRNVRLAEKRGVVVKVVPFDDGLVRGIKGIYDETPIRQGRQFLHYGKELEAVARENATYLDRSCFLGAYLQDELIGFIKMVYVGRTARIMQILSKNQHFDKRPANALIAKAVEECCQRQMSHFAYCRYVYGNKRNSSVTEFKRRNGFEELRFPRYYFPLSLKGRLALRCKLHMGFRRFVPEPVTERLLTLRSRFLEKTVKPVSKKVPAESEKGSPVLVSNR